ncbi:ABC-2 type transport system permease protein [Aquimarina sp. MAR_2010_214]|uniref:ABC transporter permease n=1 Tax=Aquimarina sp. MAR_2010_214 TaxID=1250026 RepID=UPI000C70684C|nr:ABC transporter permease [Aquimarina sp. MAR_2010_214]PKV52343.1 ABC-2 type transport system permease protein [Aquimarina sp. MAR_2010_214]
MSNLKLIIKREFIARVRNRTFVVMTFLSPLIMVGMISLIAWLATLNNDEIRKVAFYDETGSFSTDFKDSSDIDYIDYSHLTLNDAKDSVVIKKLDGLLYVPKKSNNNELAKSIQFYADEAPSISIINKIEGIIASKLTNQNFKEKGLDLDVIENSKAKVNILIENFSGEKTSKMSSYIKMIFGGVAGYFLMMFIIIYGNMVMRSVIEEKSNRIIEIIISSVKPLQLMMGKILGTSFAGILQFLIWVILGSVLLTVATSVFGIDPQPAGIDQSLILQEDGQQEIQLILQDIIKLPLGTLVVSFFIYFIGGYFLYSSIYAAIGAAVDSETDSQQFMLPIILPLMLGIYVGFFSVIENPHGTVSTVFSMIPLTSPIVMLMRIPFGVPWWEVLISMLLLVGSIIFITWLAGKIYRVGILMYGKKPSYKELFKWMKY